MNAQHDDGITYWAALGHNFAREFTRTMKEYHLRLTGKMLATACISVMVMGGYGLDPETAAWGITLIWVISIPEFAEAMVRVRREQRQRERTGASE